MQKIKCHDNGIIGVIIMRICKPYPFEKRFQLKDPQNSMTWHIFDVHWYSCEDRFTTDHTKYS
jgi:hypothetical protein